MDRKERQSSRLILNSSLAMMPGLVLMGMSNFEEPKPSSSGLNRSMIRSTCSPVLSQGRDFGP